MRKLFFLLFLLSILRPRANGQSSFEIMIALGRIYTPAIRYQNCTGQIQPAYSPSLSLIYHPRPVWGLELNYNSLEQVTYLNDPGDQSVRVYTYSTIKFLRLQTGINYSVPLKKIHPFIGCLIGFTHATTTQTPMTSTYTSFSWTCQTGVGYYFSPYVGLRLYGELINSPNIPDNSSYFGVDKIGSGFPSFAVGNPSTANIIQWSISLGVVIRFMTTNKSK